MDRSTNRQQVVPAFGVTVCLTGPRAQLESPPRRHKSVITFVSPKRLVLPFFNYTVFHRAYNKLKHTKPLTTQYPKTILHSHPTRVFDFNPVPPGLDRIALHATRTTGTPSHAGRVKSSQCGTSSCDAPSTDISKSNPVRPLTPPHPTTKTKQALRGNPNRDGRFACAVPPAK